MRTATGREERMEGGKDGGRKGWREDRMEGGKDGGRKGDTQGFTGWYMLHVYTRMCMMQ